MADWTQDKLEEVVKKKHEEAEKKKPKTDIVCFLHSPTQLFHEILQLSHIVTFIYSQCIR